MISIPLRIAPLLLAGLLFQAPPVEPGWTSLFNGKDFTGWKISRPESFKIEDGAIVANGMAGHAFYDGPFRNHTFRNFELKVDVMARANSNGGVYVLTEYEERGGNARASGDFPSRGFEIQVNNTYPRDPVKSGSLYHVQDVTEAPAKDDDWFTEHIIVKGNTITKKDPGTGVSGNATVYGSLWSWDVQFSAGGSAMVVYSTNALTLANQVVGGQALPTTVRVDSLANCAAVPAGSSGCPS